MIATYGTRLFQMRDRIGDFNPHNCDVNSCEDEKEGCTGNEYRISKLPGNRTASGESRDHINKGPHKVERARNDGDDESEEGGVAPDGLLKEASSGKRGF
jgi:hypothetical protein